MLSFQYFRNGIYIWVFLCLFSKPTRAESVTEFLHFFHTNPKLAMERLPPEIDSQGRTKKRGYIRDSSSEWEAYHLARKAVRASIMANSALEIREEGEDKRSENQDLPERIIEPGEIIRNIPLMQKRGMTQASLSIAPWSDSYWPLYKGMTGIRYADPQFPSSKDWFVNYSYILNNDATAIIYSSDLRLINTLSPAEKYDYVMGDFDFTLTKFAWRQGQRYYDTMERVPTWMGICHGWAAAAHMNVPYPQTAQTVFTSSGNPVIFYPQDIKALQSMLWANSPPKTRFAGTRCAKAKPERNSNGRIMDEKCFDVSPATWHVAVTNQLSTNKRSFVMDATYDAEVWNFPILSYTYQYFNPQTWQSGNIFKAAVIPIEKFTVDKFKEFRSPRAKSILGIVMDVTLIKEMNPSRQLPKNAPTKTLRFVYDLELTEDQEIIGGEWYSNAHPDFLWTFNNDAYARTKEDASITADSWAGDSPIPSYWTNLAQSASSRGAPLRAFLSRFSKRAK